MYEVKQAERRLNKKAVAGINIVILDFIWRVGGGSPRTERMTRKSRYTDINVHRIWLQNENKKGIPNRILQGSIMLEILKVEGTKPAEYNNND